MDRPQRLRDDLERGLIPEKTSERGANGRIDLTLRAVASTAIA